MQDQENVHMDDFQIDGLAVLRQLVARIREVDAAVTVAAKHGNSAQYAMLLEQFYTLSSVARMFGTDNLYRVMAEPTD